MSTLTAVKEACQHELGQHDERKQMQSLHMKKLSQQYALLDIYDFLPVKSGKKSRLTYCYQGLGIDQEKKIMSKTCNKPCYSSDFNATQKHLLVDSING